MAIPLRSALMQHLDDLRFEPTEKRIRGVLDDHTVIDTTRRCSCREPKRVVPTYAVPVEDVDADVVVAQPDEADRPDGVRDGRSARERRCTTRASRSPCTPPMANRWRSVCDVAPGMRPPTARRTPRSTVVTDFAGFDYGRRG